MLSQMDRIINKIKPVLTTIMTTIGIVMLVVAWVSVFSRYVLNHSLTWSEELQKILLVWFCLLSTSVISLNREHMGIVIFKEMMPLKVQRIMSLITQVVIAVICAVVVGIGVEMIIAAGDRLIPALQIPYTWSYSAVPVSFIIITFYEIRNTIYDFTNYKNSKVS